MTSSPMPNPHSWSHNVSWSQVAGEPARAVRTVDPGWAANRRPQLRTASSRWGETTNNGVRTVDRSRSSSSWGPVDSVAHLPSKSDSRGRAVRAAEGGRPGRRPKVGRHRADKRTVEESAPPATRAGAGPEQSRLRISRSIFMVGVAVVTMAGFLSLAAPGRTVQAAGGTQPT